MKEEYQDRIENYLLNRMSDTDRLAFEHDLEKDAELRDQYEFISMVKTALMLENIDKDVTNWSNAYKERKKQKVAAAKGRKLLYWTSGIAAVFVVGFFIFNNTVFYNASPSLNNSDLYSDSVVFRGSGVEADIERLLAQGDYKNALAQIETLEENFSTELLILGRERGVRGVEHDESDDKQVILKHELEELLWLKVHAYFGLNRAEEAISLLDEIRHSESEYKAQADSLYNILKK